MPAQGNEIDNYLATSGTKGSSFFLFSTQKALKKHRGGYTKSYKKAKLKL